ncbi:MAG: hypothetical protein JKY93_09230 [Gammaproteobacteria bacterium]|nr:hypothetical protein [Gammaproteobacteria bacterium]
MIGMFKHSIILFYKGRLFQDLSHVIKQACIGIFISAAIVIGLIKMGLALWIAVVTASLVSGALQPYFFKDLKFE